MSNGNTAREIEKRRKSRGTARLVMVLLILVWVYCYNLLIKDQDLSESFFKILDTVSDDFVQGTLKTVAIGVGIVVVFSATKLYTQIVANIYSYRIIEELIYGPLLHGRYREFLHKMVHFEDHEDPQTACPERVSSLLMSLTFVYVMSWIYVILFSEALFFVSWSAGVDLDVDLNTVQLLPTIALAIPFSARVMAYVRYPYTQDYADFMPGALFVLLLVAALGYLFDKSEGGRQAFFLLRVYENDEFQFFFLKRGALLSFVPIFFEAAFWMFELAREDTKLREARDEQVARDAGEREPAPTEPIGLV